MSDVSQIEKHAHVIGADGVHVGTRNHVQDGRIKLTKTNSSDRKYHFVSSSLVAEVEDGTVRLSENADVAVTLEDDE